MHVLGTLLLRIITVLFFVGMAGSAVVVVLAFVEDFRDLFGPDEPGPAPEQRSSSVAPRSPAHS